MHFSPFFSLFDVLWPCNLVVPSCRCIFTFFSHRNRWRHLLFPSPWICPPFAPQVVFDSPQVHDLPGGSEFLRHHNLWLQYGLQPSTSSTSLALTVPLVTCQPVRLPGSKSHLTRWRKSAASPIPPPSQPCPFWRLELLKPFCHSEDICWSKNHANRSQVESFSFCSWIYNIMFYVCQCWSFAVGRLLSPLSWLHTQSRRSPTSTIQMIKISKSGWFGHKKKNRKQAHGQNWVKIASEFLQVIWSYDMFFSFFFGSPISYSKAGM